MKPDILIIKYLLSEGVNIKTSNVFVDNSIITDRAEKCSSLLDKAIVFKGHIVMYINPYKFIFKTIEGVELLVYTDKSIHISEDKDCVILVYADLAHPELFNLIYYDRV